jgi:glycosyltransferase involved in cell wall biosynthesis
MPSNATARVLHFSTVHRANDTRIFAKECVSLASAGFAVSQVTLASTATTATIDGVTCTTLPAPPGRLTRMTVGQWRMLRHVLTTPADIYHFHDPELMPVGLLLRMLGRCVVFDSHEHIAKDLGEKPWLNAFGRTVARAVGRLIELAADRLMSGVIVTTPGMRQAYPTGRTVLLRNFPKRSEFAAPPPWNLRSDTVCYVGLISDFRGSRQIARLADRSSAKVVIAGRLPEEERLKLEQEPGWTAVEYRGSLGRDEVVSLLSEARIGLAILLPMQNFEDSIPTKLLEYLAAGIPAVASDFKTWRALVGDTNCAVFVDPLDEDELVRVVEELLADPKRAELMGRAGRALVLEHYVWEREVQNLFELYAALLESSGVPVSPSSGSRLAADPK